MYCLKLILNQPNFFREDTESQFLSLTPKPYLGQYENAMGAYKQAIRLKPDSVKAHLNLGMAFIKLGDRGSALEEFKILKQLDQESANQLFNLIYD